MRALDIQFSIPFEVAEVINEEADKVAERKRKKAEYNRKYNEENRDKKLEHARKYYEENRDKRLEYDRKYYEENPSKYLIKGAHRRSKKYGIPFNITQEDVVIPDVCPYLNIPLVTAKGVVSSNSPSLDRIIPELGYVKGNIQVISHKANTMKHNATPEELRLFAINILRYH